MHLALKSAMSRIPYTNKVGETLSSIADSAAAYSLRALGGGDPMVARVRRSSDDAEKDFTASDMDSGSVADWANGKQDTTLPCDVASAAAAYSLRSVNSNYTGSIVRVRRSSDDAEKDFSDVSLIADWVNEDVVITNATFVNINGTYDTFSGSSSSGFTATNTASDGRALSNLTISTPQVGDKFRINYNLTLNSGSGIKFLLATSTGSNASNSVDVTSSGTGSIELTANNLDIATLRINAIGNVDFVVSDISVTAIQSSGFVTTWYDQSGNGNNATQSTASSQPKIVDAGVLVGDGIKFDGVDDKLVKYSFEQGALSQPNYIFGVGSIISDLGYICDGSNSSFRNLLFKTNDEFKMFAGITVGIKTSDTNVHLFSSLFNQTNSHAYIDGVLEGSSLDVGSMSMGGITIGARYSGSTTQGSISEIIIYDSDQSANRFKIESNINNHYGLYTNANDGFVTSWYDQSGNSNDATQSTAANQPKIVDGGVYLGELAFDGASELASSVSVNIAQLATAFSVVRPENLGTNKYIWTIGGTSGIVSYIDSDERAALFAGSTLINGALSTVDNNLKFDLCNTTSSIVAINGLSGTSGTIGSGSGNDVINIGSRGGFDFMYGSLSEIIIYDSNQSSNRAAIETNINNYYDIEFLWHPSQTTTALWLDASDLNSITSSSNQVSQWSDKSGNSITASQSTASKKPATGTRTLNNLNVIDFDSSLNHNLTGTTIPVNDTSNAMVFIVGQLDSRLNYESLFQSTNFSLGLGALIDKWRFYAGGSAFLGPSGSVDFSPHVFSVGLDDGTDVALNIDGSLIQSETSTPLTLSSSGFHVGSRNDQYHADCSIGEIIVINNFDEILRQKVEGYLAHKWGLQSNLPVNHPYKSSAPLI